MTSLAVTLSEHALAHHVAVLGKTGSGKTYAARTIIEPLIAAGERVCIVDPTGVWWGLRAGPDGSPEGGLPVVILGGDHGDLPLTDTMGAAVGAMVAGSDARVVVDTGEMSAGGRRRFMAAFLEELYRANRARLYLILDEADECAPQNPPPDGTRALGAADRIVRRGRTRGFRVWLISQRPAVINKNLLTQAETLIAMRLPSAQDRKALEEWIKAQGDTDQQRDVMQRIGRLGLGEGFVWEPTQERLEQVKFPRITTYDSGRTPNDDAPAPDVVLGAMDLGALREHLDAAVAEAQANDPKRLRERIAELERELADPRRPVAGQVLDEITRVKREASEMLQDYREQIARYESDLKRARDVLLQIRGLADPDELAIVVAGCKPAQNIHKNIPVENDQPLKHRAPGSAQNGELSTPARAQPVVVVGDRDLSDPHQRIADAVAYLYDAGVETPTREQVALIAGYTVGGRFNRLVGEMRTAGLVEYPTGNALALTDEGWRCADSPRRRPTVADLCARVFEALDGPHRTVLKALLYGPYSTASRDDLAKISGYTVGGRFNRLVGRLKTLGLVTYPTPGAVAPADFLCDEVAS